MPAVLSNSSSASEGKHNSTVLLPLTKAKVAAQLQRKPGGRKKDWCCMVHDRLAQDCQDHDVCCWCRPQKGQTHVARRTMKCGHMVAWLELTGWSSTTDRMSSAKSSCRPAD